jgi:DNA-binding GntR family transcriptional regulator
VYINVSDIADSYLHILRGVAPVRQTEDEHKSLLEAALRRDAKGAVQLLRKHIHNVAAGIEGAL